MFPRLLRGPSALLAKSSLRSAKCGSLLPPGRKRKNEVADPNQRKLTAFGFSTSKELSVAASAPVPGAVSPERVVAASHAALQSSASTPVPCELPSPDTVQLRS